MKCKFIMLENTQIAEFVKCAGKTIQTSTNARMKKAPHVHTKKIYALGDQERYLKRRFLVTKFLRVRVLLR